MELNVTTLEGKAAGSVKLSDEIFGLEPRKDIIQRVVHTGHGHGLFLVPIRGCKGQGR